MTGTEAITNRSNRIDAVDALRGFALIGVGLVHVLEQHAGAAHTEQIMEVAAATGPDQVIMGVHQMLLAGKFYVLFSLLFGLSFFIQIDRSDQQGEAISGRFVWRLAILFMFGYIHHLFYRSDMAPGPLQAGHRSA